MYFKEYKNCIFCGSAELIKEKKQFYPKNFYLKAIQFDLKISEKKFKQMKVYKCKSCSILQNNPWFTENICRKIYSNIYGQHNRGWSNLINFIKKGFTPAHGSLFKILNKKIKIKNYAEFNSPFMGIFLNFFLNEYKESLNFYSKLSENVINYLTSRQVAGKSKKFQKLSFGKSQRFFTKMNFLKNKNIKKKLVKKYLYVDNSSLCWGQNDNYKSVNSKSFASEFLDLEILNLKESNKKNKIDLFGIFHTLDHTFEPNKILNFALDNSKFVVVYCHVDEKLNKQHLFSLTRDFLKYLKKKKIYNIDLTNKINKNYQSPELYFLCSRNKNNIEKIKW